MPRFGNFATNTNRAFGLGNRKSAAAGGFGLVGFTHNPNTGVSTLPTHQAGDILIIGATSTPNPITAAAGWTALNITNFFFFSTNFYTIMYAQKATGSGTAVGTWTNALASNLPNFAMVYRGFSNFGTGQGAYDTGDTIWNSFTPSVTNGTSILINVGYQTGGTTSLTTSAPAGWSVDQSSVAAAASGTNSMKVWNSVTGLASWAGYTATGDAINIRQTFELKA